MTGEDRERFMRAAITCAEALGCEMTPARLAIYSEVLADLPIQALERAFFEATRSMRFFPKPVELRDLATAGSGALSLEDQAEMALRLVEQNNNSWTSVRFSDPIIHAAVERLGGWIAVCKTIREMPDDQYGFWQRDFRRVYIVCARMGAVAPEHLAGQIEATNAERWPGHIPSPTTIECPYLPQGRSIDEGSGGDDAAFLMKLPVKGFPEGPK